MPPLTQSNDPSHSGARAALLKLAALVLVVCALGLPVNDLAGYACLAAATVIFCIGNITTSRRRLPASRSS